MGRICTKTTELEIAGASSALEWEVAMPVSIREESKESETKKGGGGEPVGKESVQVPEC